MIFHNGDRVYHRMRERCGVVVDPRENGNNQIGVLFDGDTAPVEVLADWCALRKPRPKLAKVVSALFLREVQS